MKLYLDDERKTPVGWVRVFWPDEAIAWLKTEMVTEISLDHDLGDDDRGTGYDVILWIENEVMTNNFIPPKIHIHSANVSARIKMELGIMAINNFLAKSK
ncbi:cyclic-phosphate processing receiver domain-containing protein [Aeromonas dhakensis]|uniref:cyclic-phosphate processing receiver domain-containing protein n=1 Tax=Aeromonas dhakensis TaxID=196024 RepID=UPI0038D0B23B